MTTRGAFVRCLGQMITCTPALILKTFKAKKDASMMFIWTNLVEIKGNAQNYAKMAII